MTIKEELIQYAKDCINDTKHCCQKHRWACERFLRDISREGTDEFPYIFDDAKAEVIKALSILGDEYVGLLNEAFDNKWIDVYAKDNKDDKRQKFGLRIHSARNDACESQGV